MILDAIEFFSVARQRMDYLTTRHRLIAENVANADSPSYRTQDLLPFEKAVRAAASSAPRRTHELHLVGLRGPQSFRADRTADGWEKAPNDNNVVLEQEMLKANEVMGAHALVSNLYKKHVDMVRTAFSGRV